MDWWLDTQAILVRGASGVIVYGEVAPLAGELAVKEGTQIQRGQYFCQVVPVLPPEKLRPDIPGHSCSMLHVELYTDIYPDLERGVWEGWEIGHDKPDRLVNPTDRLLKAKPPWVKILMGKS